LDLTGNFLHGTGNGYERYRRTRGVAPSRTTSDKRRHEASDVEGTNRWRRLIRWFGHPFGPEHIDWANNVRQFLDSREWVEQEFCGTQGRRFPPSSGAARGQRRAGVDRAAWSGRLRLGARVRPAGHRLPAGRRRWPRPRNAVTWSLLLGISGVWARRRACWIAGARPARPGG